MREKIRVAELFSGYGSQSMALERLRCENVGRFDFEVVLVSEIDANALKAYEATHGNCPNVGDISCVVWSEQPDFDLATWSFPCTDLSVASKQMGMSKDSGTRSSLAWEALRCFRDKRPKWLLMENVPALAQKKFIRDFHALQYELEQIGYTNFCAILNSASYGVPQHRERLFMVSILDCDKPYYFPKPFKLEKRIKDVLEPYGTVDESFYFSAKQLTNMFDYCKRKKIEGCGFHTNFRREDNIASCVTTRYGAEYTNTYLLEPELRQRLSIYDNNAQAGRIYDFEGVAPCLDTCNGGNRMPNILVPFSVAMRGRNPQKTSDRSKGAPTKQRLEFGGNIANCITTVQKDSMTAEPMVGNNPQRIFGRDDSRSDVVPALMAMDSKGAKLVKEPMGLSFDTPPDKTVFTSEDGKGYLWQDGGLWRVRKLTPRECFRLQDVSDKDIDKMLSAKISKTRCYELAGNSITVNVLTCIFRKLFIDTDNENLQLSLF